MAKYRFVGSHADSLADGRPVEPGEFVHLSDEEALEPHNASLLADGRMIPTGEKSEEISERAQRAQAREETKQQERSES